MAKRLDAGELGHRIDLLRPERSQDSSGDPVTTWATAARNVAAKVRPIGGREYQQARQTVAATTYEITIRWRTDIESDWRVRWMGRLLDIEAIPPTEGRRDALRVMCVDNREAMTA